MVDLVKYSNEDLFQRVQRCDSLSPKDKTILIDLFTEQNQSIFMLQSAVTDLMAHMDGMIGALRLSQQLHQQNKSALDKINKRYDDPHGKDVLSQAMKDS